MNQTADYKIKKRSCSSRHKNCVYLLPTKRFVIVITKSSSHLVRMWFSYRWIFFVVKEETSKFTTVLIHSVNNLNVKPTITSFSKGGRWNFVKLFWSYIGYYLRILSQQYLNISMYSKTIHICFEMMLYIPHDICFDAKNIAFG